MKTPTHESITLTIIAHFGAYWVLLVIADKFGFETRDFFDWLACLVVFIGPVWAEAVSLECALDRLFFGIEGTYRNRDERWWA